MLNHPRQIIHAIYGGDEVLMWNVDRIITAIDFTVSKQEKGAVRSSTCTNGKMS
jgi:hypothetical protein